MLQREGSRGSLCSRATCSLGSFFTTSVTRSRVRKRLLLRAASRLIFRLYVEMQDEINGDKELAQPISSGSKSLSPLICTSNRDLHSGSYYAPQSTAIVVFNTWYLVYRCSPECSVQKGIRFNSTQRQQAGERTANLSAVNINKHGRCDCALNIMVIMNATFLCSRCTGHCDTWLTSDRSCDSSQVTVCAASINIVSLLSR